MRRKNKHISCLMDLAIVKCMFSKNDHIDIYRDDYSKYFIRLNGEVVKKRLNSNNCVIWLCEYIENLK